MVCNKPIYLANGDLLLPLYDERNWTSHMYISSDDGKTWVQSGSIVGASGCFTLLFRGV
jgi:hypothetical protein